MYVVCIRTYIFPHLDIRERIHSILMSFVCSLVLAPSVPLPPSSLSLPQPAPLPFAIGVQWYHDYRPHSRSTELVCVCVDVECAECTELHCTHHSICTKHRTSTQSTVDGAQPQHSAHDRVVSLFANPYSSSSMPIYRNNSSSNLWTQNKYNIILLCPRVAISLRKLLGCLIFFRFYVLTIDAENGNETANESWKKKKRKRSTYTCIRVHTQRTGEEEEKEKEKEKVAIVLSDMCETFCRCETEWMNKKKGWESKYLLT